MAPAAVVAPLFLPPPPLLPCVYMLLSLCLDANLFFFLVHDVYYVCSCAVCLIPRFFCGTNLPSVFLSRASDTAALWNRPIVSCRQFFLCFFLCVAAFLSLGFVVVYSINTCSVFEEGFPRVGCIY